MALPNGEFVASPTIRMKPANCESIQLFIPLNGNFFLELVVYFNHLLTWNASVQTSGTNNAGRGPVAFRIAVKMSIFVKPKNEINTLILIANQNASKIEIEHTGQRMNAVQCSTKCLVENVADPSTATQFSCLNVPGRSFDRRTISTGKLRNDLQQRLTFVCDIFTVRIEKRLKLWDHHIDASLFRRDWGVRYPGFGSFFNRMHSKYLEIGQTVSNVMH